MQIRSNQMKPNKINKTIRITTRKDKIIGCKNVANNNNSSI